VDLRKIRAIILLAALLALALAAVVATELLTPRQGFPGTKAILDHAQINESVSSGKGTVLYFSAPNCAVCMFQDVSMDAAYSEYNQQVNFIYFKYSPALEGVFEDWSVIKVPTLVFINKEGVVVSRHNGNYLNVEELKKEIEMIR
jgi:thiol-disulfide isomerase/thioredoxin